jgi:hypothetical protein
MKKTTMLCTLLSLLMLAGACSSVTVDDELMSALRKAADECDLDMKYAFVRGEQAEVVSEMILKQKGAVASLPTLAVALNDEDPKLRVVANKYLYREIKDNMNDFARDLEATPRAVVKKLIKGIEQSSDYVTYYAVAATTMLATMYALEGDLIKAVEKHPEKALKFEMMTNLLRFGRVRVFPILQAYAESGEKNALERVLLNLYTLYTRTDEETRVIGSWLLTQLPNEDPKMRALVINELSRLGGSYFDAALDQVEKEINTGELAAPVLKKMEELGYGESAAHKERRLALIDKAKAL